MASIPNIPELQAITLGMTLNREGLVADCIFPLVPTACAFSYMDWEAELKELKSIDDHVTCKSDAKEIDGISFKLKQAAVSAHALSQVMDECCVVICGDATIDSKIAAAKTRQLTNKLLIGREQRAISLALDSTKYTDNLTKDIDDETAVIDGGIFNITEANFTNVNYNLRRYFQGINENANFGARNVMITDRATLNTMLGNQSFIGYGCSVDPETTDDKVAALLGVDKICIADAKYNDGLGETVNLKKFWPKGTILFVASYEMVTSQDPQFSFGITAYTQPIQQNMWVDEKKGMGAGATMQKIGHDMTEVVLSYKAATIVKVTPTP